MEFTAWQDRWIATNLLGLGDNAWVGYLRAGRGVVVCTPNTPLSALRGKRFLPTLCLGNA